MTPKQALLRELGAVERHYGGCPTCAAGPQPCATGRRLWSRVIARHSDVVLACIHWHLVRATGTARVARLARKLLAVPALKEPV